MSDYDGIHRVVRAARETLQEHIVSALEMFLRKELGIWLTDSQRDKLHCWVDEEKVA